MNDKERLTFGTAEREFKHIDPVTGKTGSTRSRATDLDHAAVDGGMAASSTGPVRICNECGERIR